MLERKENSTIGVMLSVFIRIYVYLHVKLSRRETRRKEKDVDNLFFFTIVRSSDLDGEKSYLTTVTYKYVSVKIDIIAIESVNLLVCVLVYL